MPDCAATKIKTSVPSGSSPRGTSSNGEPGIVVVECDNSDKLGLIKEQLSGVFKVIRGKTELVEVINKIAVMEGINAAVAAREKLSELDLPKEWIDVAINTVCAGMIKAFVKNDLGPFAENLVQRAEQNFPKRKTEPSMDD